MEGSSPSLSSSLISQSCFLYDTFLIFFCITTNVDRFSPSPRGRGRLSYINTSRQHVTYRVAISKSWGDEASSRSHPSLSLSLARAHTPYRVEFTRCSFPSWGPIPTRAGQCQRHLIYASLIYRLRLLNHHRPYEMPNIQHAIYEKNCLSLLFPPTHLQLSSHVINSTAEAVTVGNYRRAPILVLNAFTGNITKQQSDLRLNCQNRGDLGVCLF